ncbi:MAG TPA: hypothetical protein PKK06_15775 [Phycisphaerae bacterium]|nr:hypothetical protein [Phycisphaerae bacterium]HNU47024.1 hypothetical protein [Phycisphaerae bacterium]
MQRAAEFLSLMTAMVSSVAGGFWLAGGVKTAGSGGNVSLVCWARRLGPQAEIVDGAQAGITLSLNASRAPGAAPVNTESAVAATRAELARTDGAPEAPVPAPQSAPQAFPPAPAADHATEAGDTSSPTGSEGPVPAASPSLPSSRTQAACGSQKQSGGTSCRARPAWQAGSARSAPARPARADADRPLYAGVALADVAAPRPSGTLSMPTGGAAPRQTRGAAGCAPATAVRAAANRTAGSREPGGRAGSCAASLGPAARYTIAPVREVTSSSPRLVSLPTYSTRVRPAHVSWPAETFLTEAFDAFGSGEGESVIVSERTFVRVQTEMLVE